MTQTKIPILLNSVNEDEFTCLEGLVCQDFRARKINKRIYADSFAEIVNTLQFASHADLFDYFLSLGCLYAVGLRVVESNFSHIKHKFEDVRIGSFLTLRKDMLTEPLLQWASDIGNITDDSKLHYLRVWMRDRKSIPPSLEGASLQFYKQAAQPSVITLGKMILPAHYASFFSWITPPSGNYTAALFDHSKTSSRGH